MSNGLFVNNYLNGNNQPQPAPLSNIGGSPYMSSLINSIAPGGPTVTYPPRDNGDTLGEKAPTPNYNTGGGTGGGGPSPIPNQGSNNNQGPNESDRLRSEIGGAYDAYLSGLDNMVGNFGQQRKDQEGIVGSQYNQGVNSLQGQLASGMNTLNQKRTGAQEGQKKTLRDLENNVRNMFQAGNVYLGAKGAGDSSASNMYSYAVTQMGNKNRGEAMGQTRSIMNDIDGREFELKNTVDTETRNLEEMKNQKMLEVAQWYSEAVNNVQQMKAQGQLERGVSLANVTRDLLNQATQRAMMIEQNAMNQKNALMEWAMQQGQSINQIRNSMGNMTNVQYAAPQAGELNAAPTVDSQGNMYTPAGYGYGNEDEKRQAFF